MFKIKKTYEDFLGNEQTETFRFNITESEMMDMVKSDPTFKPEYLIYLAQEQKAFEMLDVIRKLLVISYGELSEDGKHFLKSDEKATLFVQSAAYNEILNDFITSKDENLLKNFVINTFPKKYTEEAMKNSANFPKLEVNNN